MGAFVVFYGILQSNKLMEIIKEATAVSQIFVVVNWCQVVAHLTMKSQIKEKQFKTSIGSVLDWVINRHTGVLS